MNNTVEAKKILRKEQSEIRKKLHSLNRNIFNQDLFNELFNNLKITNSTIISSFISINSEISTEKLNNLILKKNKILCLPCILKKKLSLSF